jgi:hypothetical protein
MTQPEESMQRMDERQFMICFFGTRDFLKAPLSVGASTVDAIDLAVVGSDGIQTKLGLETGWVFSTD